MKLARRIVIFVVFAAVIVVIMAAGWQRWRDDRFLVEFPPPGERIELAADYALHIRCVGEGTPAVVLQCGQGCGVAYWELVQSRVNRVAKVCSFDAAGIGWSDAANKVVDSEAQVQQLHQLLATAGVPPPYILVAHSAAGNDARVFADRYPDDVAGIVFVDATARRDEDDTAVERQIDAHIVGVVDRCRTLAPWGLIRLMGALHLIRPPAALRRLDETMGQAALADFYRSRYCQTVFEQMSSFKRSSTEAENSKLRADLPIIAISGRAGPDLPQRQDDQVLEASFERQATRLAALSRVGRHVIAAGSGHFVQIDRPDIVADAISELVRLRNEEQR